MPWQNLTSTGCGIKVSLLNIVHNILNFIDLVELIVYVSNIFSRLMRLSTLEQLLQGTVTSTWRKSLKSQKRAGHRYQINSTISPSRDFGILKIKKNLFRSKIKSIFTWNQKPETCAHTS